MHLTDDEALLWHIDRDSREPARVLHVQSCIPCRKLLEETQSFIEDLSADESWRDGAASEQNLTGMQEIATLEARLRHEEAEAERLIGRVTELEREVRVRPTAGLSRALVSASAEMLERDPAESGRLGDLAILAASLLDPNSYPADLLAVTRGAAWRQRANTLRMRGVLQDALLALDEAAREFRKTRVSAPELATLDYIRATIYWTQGRVRDARKLLDSSIATFEAFGDETRLRHARLLLSGLHYREGDIRTAVDILRGLLRDTPTSDTVLRGRILQNLGVYLLRSDTAKARLYLQQAQHCLRLAGLRTEAFRASWNLARAEVILGQDDAAEESLRSAWEEAAALHLEVDVAMIALDRAELLMKQQDYGRVTRLCREALSVFQQSGAAWFAADAFAYLEMAARLQTLSNADLRHVRRYVETSARRPEPFTRPD